MMGVKRPRVVTRADTSVRCPPVPFRQDGAAAPRTNGIASADSGSGDRLRERPHPAPARTNGDVAGTSSSRDELDRAVRRVSPGVRYLRCVSVRRGAHPVAQRATRPSTLAGSPLTPAKGIRLSFRESTRKTLMPGLPWPSWSGFSA